MMVLTLIWTLAGAEAVDTYRVDACPTHYQVQAFAASNAMRRDWKLARWTCGVAS